MTQKYYYSVHKTMAKIVLKTIPSNNGVVNTLISIAQLSDLTARELEGSDIPVTDSFQ